MIAQLLKTFEEWYQREGRTQREMASKLGVSQQHLCRVLHGKGKASVDLIDNIYEIMVNEGGIKKLW